MKKLAFCLTLLALGTITFAGCAKDSATPEPSADIEAPGDEGGEDAATPGDEEGSAGGAEEGAGEEAEKEAAE